MASSALQTSLNTPPCPQPDARLDEPLLDEPMIALLAHDLWQARGYPTSGSDLDDLFLATLDIVERQNLRIAELETAAAESTPPFDESTICLLARDLREARAYPASGSDVEDLLLATLQIIGRQNQRIAELESAIQPPDDAKFAWEAHLLGRSVVISSSRSLRYPLGVWLSVLAVVVLAASAAFAAGYASGAARAAELVHQTPPGLIDLPIVVGPIPLTQTLAAY